MGSSRSRRSAPRCQKRGEGSGGCPRGDEANDEECEGGCRDAAAQVAKMASIVTVTPEWPCAVDVSSSRKQSVVLLLAEQHVVGSHLTTFHLIMPFLAMVQAVDRAEGFIRGQNSEDRSTGGAHGRHGRVHASAGKYCARSPFASQDGKEHTCTYPTPMQRHMTAPMPSLRVPSLQFTPRSHPMQCRSLRPRSESCG